MDQEYWDERAKQFGILAVGNSSWDEKRYEEVTKRVTKFLLPHMPNPNGVKRLLDFGCGVGRLGSFLVKLYGFDSYTGIDLSPELLKMARKRHPRLRFLQVSSKFPFADKVFDLVLSCTVLQHIADDVEFTIAIQELARVARKHLVVYENTTTKLKPKDYYHLKFRPVEEYIRAFKDAGATLVAMESKEEAAGEVHTLFLGKVD